MGSALVGIAALLIIFWFMHKYVQANPRGMAYLLQKGGGLLSLVTAFFLAVRGQLAVALPLALMGFGLLGWMQGGVFGSWWPKGRGQVSRLRSAFLEIEIDHVTGAMHGRIIAGRAAGVALETLDNATLTALLGEFDDESRKLLMAYLDRRRAGWGENAQGGAHARQGAAASSGKVSEEEAYQILGLQPGASAEEIGRAYRSLMKKLHPDQGGSTYLAARINEAKEVLLRRHR
jgi:DnaJ-like protein